MFWYYHINTPLLKISPGKCCGRPILKMKLSIQKTVTFIKDRSLLEDKALMKVANLENLENLDLFSGGDLLSYF